MQSYSSISGLALRHSIGIGAGVADKDYNRPIKVILRNNGKDDFVGRLEIELPSYC